MAVMLFGWYFDWTFIILIPGIIFSLWAQIRVNTTFSHYSKVRNFRGVTGAQAAQMILSANGIHDVRIERIRGNLNDHYSPKEKVIRLSDAVFDSDSIGAVGVAAHEAGHAVQYAKNYAPIGIRMAIIPVVNIGSYLAMPIFIIGLIFAFEPLMMAGIALFSLAIVFQLITLPVEFDASNRALEAIDSQGILYGDEAKGARKVLSAAAMTYVAALFASLLSLLRLVVIANNRRR